MKIFYSVFDLLGVQISNNNDSDSVSIGAVGVIGGVVAGVILLLMIIVVLCIIILCMRRSHRKKNISVD